MIIDSEKRAKKLETVRNLLARANHPKTPEPEAESCRLKADQLMTAFAIEQWQVDVSSDERVKPEIRKVNIDWWYDTKDFDSASEIWWMFHRVYQHCRCVVAQRGQERRLMPVIGLASDLDWADQLFTSLMLQMNRNLIVRADDSKSLAENVYAMRMAGMGWMYITELLWTAGLVEAPRGKAGVTYRYDYDKREYVEEPITTETPWNGIPDRTRQVIKNRLAQINRNHAREHGLERNYVRPDIYQRSFIEGFSTEVRMRLYKMSRESERAYDAEHGADSMALVVRDIYQQALDLYNQEFPPPKPDPNAKPRKSRAVAYRPKVTDSSARAAGAREGSKANLSNQPSERLSNQSPRLPR